MLTLSNDSELSNDSDNALILLSACERAAFEQFVPPDHFLRRLLQAVDFESFRPLLASGYSPDQGRPPLDPVVVLKIAVLAHQYKYSDREVMAATEFNIAYRLFLGLSLESPLPHPTSMTYFRGRLGTKRLQEIFDDLVRQARRLGLVKDRLRLKDATHIIANIAVPSTIRLVAQTRDRLLDALRPFAPERVLEETQHAEAITLATKEAKDEVRLLRRVDHLRDILTWADQVPTPAVCAAHTETEHERLTSALALTHKILDDRDGDGGDKVLSVHDPDARRGKHGQFYEGYQFDMAMDADSEIITAINVLPGNGDEGADAALLIAQEEKAQGNDVEAVSIDGAGFRGTVLRELTDPDGLHLEVFTPPSKVPPPAGFPAERFTLTMVDDRPTLTCPAGQTTQTRERNADGTGYRYRFKESQCSGCALRAECLAKPNAKKRMVVKNDYEAEYAAARAKAQTPEYEKVRRRHPAVERKLSELVRRHDLRHARYRGRPGVLYQGLMTSLVVNLKRVVRLLFAPQQATTSAVRALVGAAVAGSEG